MQRKKRHGFSMALAGALALAGLFALTAAILLRPEKRLSIPEPVQATEAPAEEVYTTPQRQKVSPGILRLPEKQRKFENMDA